jgi:hypothetical protein
VVVGARKDVGVGLRVLKDQLAARAPDKLEAVAL